MTSSKIASRWLIEKQNWKRREFGSGRWERRKNDGESKRKLCIKVPIFQFHICPIYREKERQDAQAAAEKLNRESTPKSDSSGPTSDASGRGTYNEEIDKILTDYGKHMHSWFIENVMW